MNAVSIASDRRQGLYTCGRRLQLPCPIRFAFPDVVAIDAGASPNVCIAALTPRIKCPFFERTPAKGRRRYPHSQTVARVTPRDRPTANTRCATKLLREVNVESPSIESPRTQKSVQSERPLVRNLRIARCRSVARFRVLHLSNPEAINAREIFFQKHLHQKAQHEYRHWRVFDDRLRPATFRDVDDDAIARTWRHARPH